MKTKVTDDVVKNIIKLHLLNGYNSEELARRFLMKPRVIRQWLSGENRGHLLLQVQKELEKENGQSVHQPQKDP